MSIEVDPAHDCDDPGLRQIIQYLSLKWGPIKPCSNKSWRECVTTDDNGHECLWFNDANETTHIYWLSR